MKSGQVQPGRRRHPKPAPSQIKHCQLILTVVGEMTGVGHQEFFARSRRCMTTANARQLAMYLCHVLTGLSMTDVGVFFGRDRTTVSYACALIEDSREDRQVEARIEMIERRVEAMRHPNRSFPGREMGAAHAA